MQLLFVLEDASVKKLAFLAQLFAKLYTKTYSYKLRYRAWDSQLC